jgi:hypothetical protein
MLWPLSWEVASGPDPDRAPTTLRPDPDRLVVVDAGFAPCDPSTRGSDLHKVYQTPPRLRAAFPTGFMRTRVFCRASQGLNWFHGSDQLREL